MDRQQQQSRSRKPNGAEARPFTPRSERHPILGVLVRAVAQAPSSGGPERWPERLSPSARDAVADALRRAHRDGSFFAAVRELATVASLLGRGQGRSRLRDELLGLVPEVLGKLGAPREGPARASRAELIGSRSAVRAPKIGERAPKDSLKAARFHRSLRM